MKAGRIGEYGAVFCIGMLGYSALEILWRGYTHWTMSLTGGTCLVLLDQLALHTAQWGLMRRCAAGCGVITGVEFLVGCVVNLLLDWNVWDYSHMPFQLLGQVCLGFSMLWFLLCIPLLMGAPLLRRVLQRRLRRPGW